MLDFKIKSFLAVVEYGTLKNASERLGLTQPAVSQHIKGLEEYYGVPLFDHIGRRLVLNDAGRTLKDAAERSLLLSLKAEQQMRNFIEGKKFYRLGATLSIGEFIIPSYIGEYRQRNPSLELSIRIENTESILDLLDRGEVDLALVEGPFNKEKYSSKLFLQDEMIYIGTADYLPAAGTAVDENLLNKSRLILREKGSGTRFYWEEYRRRNRIALPSSSVIMEVGSLSAIKSLVEAGYGSSVMSKYAVEKELLLGSLQTSPFKWGRLFRDMYFVYSDASPAGFVSDFIEFAKRN